MSDKPAFAAHTPPADKPEKWHSLKAHLSKVAYLAGTLAAKFNARDLGFYAGLWHDLGKYNPKFQRYLQQCQESSSSGGAEPRDRAPHAIYGAKLAAEKFQPLAPLIFGHHAGLPKQSHIKNSLADIDEEAYRVILQNAQIEELELEIPSIAVHQLAALAKDPFSSEFLQRMLFSCLVDADYIDTEKHFSQNVAEQRGSKVTVTELWSLLTIAQDQLVAQASDTPVNQIRLQVYQCCLEAAQLEPGVFRLAVPTGGGKTRSGLAFALAHAGRYGMDRVIVAVPYTSIIEQTVEVIETFLVMMQCWSITAPSDLMKGTKRMRAHVKHKPV